MIEFSSFDAFEKGGHLITVEDQYFVGLRILEMKFVVIRFTKLYAAKLAAKRRLHELNLRSPLMLPLILFLHALYTSFVLPKSDL